MALRRVASRLSERIGTEVRPVSLLHSTRIDPVELSGEPAILLEDALELFAQSGGNTAIILPLFFGPSGALIEYLPPRLESLRARHRDSRFVLADCLESPDDDSAIVLSRAIRRVIEKAIAPTGQAAPSIIVTDHGSPLAAVTAVRNRIAGELSNLRQSSQQRVIAASMERREGDEYAFNEPLLERALNEVADSGQNEVVVALQFLFAGRHAGPGGDIAKICQDAEAVHPFLQIAITEPIGESPEIIELLARRFNAACH